jgi:hypothetical protein
MWLPISVSLEEAYEQALNQIKARHIPYSAGRKGTAYPVRAHSRPVTQWTTVQLPDGYLLWLLPRLQELLEAAKEELKKRDKL